jgi:predicted Fe-Mo cluster-binding NifX family protein
MRIAVTYDNGMIFQHFGHTEQFKLYDYEGDELISEQIVDTNGSGHGALAGFLNMADVDALICGGIGPGAQIALREQGIMLFAGVQGLADEAAQALAEGVLAYDPDAHCDHHGHHEGNCSHGEGYGGNCGRSHRC